MRLWVVCLVGSSLFGFAAASGDSIRLEPSADNTLFEDADGDTSNGAGPAVFAGKNNQNGGRARRALIAFDVSAVPEGATVDSVTLQLYVSNASDVLPRVMAIHRLTSAWGEEQSSATGGSGAPSTPGDASWTCAFFPDRPWREQGGDFETNPSASCVVGSVGFYAWTGSGLVADVRSWQQQPAANFGWAILGDESEPGTARRFDSREHRDALTRPSLAIHFSLPRPAPPVTWGSIKATYR